tara:strand:- start:1025 stop:1648 length:624 start_codon:yes stop_codon:yes gene_type:complete
MALFAKLKEIFSNKVESLEDSMALANPLDIQVFEGLMGESKALSYCLTTLCLDKELDINDLVSQLHPSTIEIAKKLYFEGFSEENMSLEECTAALRNEWLLFYPDAVFLEQAIRHGFDEQTQKENITDALINDANERLIDINKTCHDMFCSFMGYKNGQMPPHRIVDSVAYAIKNDMCENKELTHWFPVANAMIDDDDASTSPKPHL